MTARLRPAAPFLALFVTSALACGGQTVLGIASADAGASADGPAAHRDTGVAPHDSGTTVTVDGATCVDISPASWSLACVRDSDCTMIPTGLICVGACADACRGVPANQAGAARFAAETAPLHLAECGCTDSPIPTCYENQCTFCGLHPGPCFDSGTDASGPAPASCPAAAPTDGSACDGAIECEYGVDPDLRCDTLVTCESGAWTTTQTPSSANCSSTNSAACPSTNTGLGGACTSVGTTCVYPEERCACATRCGMLGFLGADGGPSAQWCCPDAPPSTPGCPSVRPRVGSACSGGGVCDYGFCSGNVALECTAGTWQPFTMLGCPG